MGRRGRPSSSLFSVLRFFKKTVLVFEHGLFLFFIRRKSRIVSGKFRLIAKAPLGIDFCAVFPRNIIFKGRRSHFDIWAQSFPIVYFLTVMRYRCFLFFRTHFYHLGIIFSSGANFIQFKTSLLLPLFLTFLTIFGFATGFSSGISSSFSKTYFSPKAPTISFAIFSAIFSRFLI